MMLLAGGLKRVEVRPTESTGAHAVERRKLHDLFFAFSAPFAVKSFFPTSPRRRGSRLSGSSKGGTLCALVLFLCATAIAEPTVKSIGPNLYAYISDNDSSANSTFLVGEKGILVVDTGLNA